AAHGPAYGKDSMEGKLPGENRDLLVGGSAVPQAAAAQQQRGRATISVNLRPRAARLASLNPGESGITELSGPFINLPDNILSLVHWTQPSPEFLALADPADSGMSVHDAVLSLLDRCSEDIESRLLDFLRQTDSPLQFECE